MGATLMFNNLSLRFKILLPIGSAVALAALCIILLLVNRISQISLSDSQALAEEISYRHGEAIQKEISPAINAADSLAHLLEGLKISGSLPSREKTIEIMRHILDSNPDLSGCWTAWEPNALDGRDKDYVFQPGHDRTGRFIPYWNRSGGMHLEPCVDYDNPGFNGLYYRVPKDTGQTFLTEPTTYSLNRRPVLMVSACVPIRISGKFVGVAGMDFFLDSFSRTINKIHPLQTGYAFLVSNSGIIVTHPSQDRVGTNFKDELNTPIRSTLESALVNGTVYRGIKTSPVTNSECLYVFTPVQVAPASPKWSFAVAIPMTQILENSRTTMFRGIAVGAAGLVILIILIFLISGLITRPIHQLALAADRISAGDFETTIPIHRSDEVGLLAEAVRRMVAKLREMIRSSDERNWIKAGETELNKYLRGDQETVDLAQKVISFLCRQLDCHAGAFYAFDQQAGVLRLLGSYAFRDRKSLSNEFRIGEGLVGQAALEKAPITITATPPDYLRITSGLGDAAPACILVSPFVFEGEVKGVVELAALRTFSGKELELMERVSEGLGIAFNTAESRTRLRILLDQTRQQAEALQFQQEELQQTNEELEEQTRALRDSEANLQTQQEELRVTNEELEERTRALEAQRDSIRQKNTELEQARKELETKAAELESASRYKSEFLANMSHELRTPLNSILILSQILSTNKDQNLSEKQLEFARTIHSSGSDLLNLINEVLDLAKVEAGKIELQPEAMKLEVLTEEMKRLFGPLAQQKGLQFECTIEEGLPPFVVTDTQRTQQILRNLLSNAIKFTEKGTVSLHIGRPDPSHVRMPRSLAPTRAIAFAVRDTGIGIPADKHQLVFEAFQQVDGSTSRKYGGTGLGLSISREFARYLGGEISLESEYGRGSTFTLILPETLENRSISRSFPPQDATTTARDEQTPLPIPAPPAFLQSPVPSAPAPGDVAVAPGETSYVRDDRKVTTPQDQSILIIEDDPNFVKILVDLAHERGFQCIVAEDGETGLHFADFYRPKAIILDIGLPGIDGWTVMARLKENPDTRPIPVHFMSATDSTMSAMRMGAVGFLTKPVSLDALDTVFSRIETLIARSLKRLLVVEDDEIQNRSILELIGGEDVETRSASSGEEAFQLLTRQSFDCMILDLGLADMSGLQLLERLRKTPEIAKIPVIIYTGKDLTRDEEAVLQRYSDSIIIKGVKSPERLLEETTLFLHRVEADLPQPQQELLSSAHAREAALRERTVLIADDDMRNVFALASVLEERGMHVLEARNGKEALDKLDEHPEIDLVLMDIMMPELDGYEAIRTIRRSEKFRKLPIIALTAKAMKGDKAKCIEAGASDYMSKPVEVDKLVSLLRVWLY